MNKSWSVHTVEYRFRKKKEQSNVTKKMEESKKKKKRHERVRKKKFKYRHTKFVVTNQNSDWLRNLGGRGVYTRELSGVIHSRSWLRCWLHKGIHLLDLPVKHLRSAHCTWMYLPRLKKNWLPRQKWETGAHTFHPLLEPANRVSSAVNNPFKNKASKYMRSVLWVGKSLEFPLHWRRTVSGIPYSQLS